MAVEPIEEFLYRIEQQRVKRGLGRLNDEQMRGLHKIFLEARRGNVQQQAQATQAPLAGPQPGSQLVRPPAMPMQPMLGGMR